MRNSQALFLLIAILMAAGTAQATIIVHSPAELATPPAAPEQAAPVPDTPAKEAPALQAAAPAEQAVEAPAAVAPDAVAPDVVAPAPEVPAAETPVVETPAAETPLVEKPADVEPAAELHAAETAPGQPATPAPAVTETPVREFTVPEVPVVRATAEPAPATVTPDELAERLVGGLRNSIQAAGLKSVAVTPFLRGNEDSQLIDSVISKFESKLRALGVQVVGSDRVAQVLQAQPLKNEMLLFPPALKWLAGETQADGVIVAAVFSRPSPFAGAVLYDAKGNRLDLLATRDSLLVDEPVAKAAPPVPEPAPEIVLKNGARYNGKVIHIDGDFVLIETDRALVRVRKDEIVAPKPAGTESPTDVAVPSRATVNMRDGSSYVGTIFFDGGEYYLMADKETVVRIPKKEILAVSTK